MPAEQPPSYPELLGDVLRSRDAEALRGFLVKNALRFRNATEAEELLGRSGPEMAELMHRMILARSDLGPLHASSERALGGANGSGAGSRDAPSARPSGRRSVPPGAPKGRDAR